MEIFHEFPISGVINTIRKIDTTNVDRNGQLETNPCHLQVGMFKMRQSTGFQVVFSCDKYASTNELDEHEALQSLRYVE